jgi:hypothetical protein
MRLEGHAQAIGDRSAPIEKYSRTYPERLLGTIFEKASNLAFSECKLCTGASSRMAGK